MSSDVLGTPESFFGCRLLTSAFLLVKDFREKYLICNFRCKAIKDKHAIISDNKLEGIRECCELDMNKRHLS